MKFGVVNKSTTVNRFVLHTLQRNITHLAVITRKTNIKLRILKDWKRAQFWVERNKNGLNSFPSHHLRNFDGKHICTSQKRVSKNSERVNFKGGLKRLKNSGNSGDIRTRWVIRNLAFGEPLGENIQGDLGFSRGGGRIFTILTTFFLGRPN